MECERVVEGERLNGDEIQAVLAGVRTVANPPP